jgi:type I restriction enzyme M protein
MNMLLHGIGSQEYEPIAVADSLAASPKENFDIVLTNPPFGKKSSITITGEEGKVSKEKETYEREDFWATTSNKQLNFLQHVRTLLKQNGRAAIVVPDNVLFEGGAGETVRRKLLQQCDVHTLLRLPTGLFYAQGVKANVLFFDRKPAAETPWTKKLWIYDLRTNMHFTLKTDPLKREDLDEFVKCYNAENRHNRKPTWSNELDSGSGAGMTEKGKMKGKAPHPNPLPASGERGLKGSSPARGEGIGNNGRWRAYDYEELVGRDKANLDIFWIKDESLEESENLPTPDVLAQDIVEDLEAALEQFREIAMDLGAGGPSDAKG